MRVLITGATGYIGAAVARATHAAGHEVLALAHNDAASRAARAHGYTPAPGDLADLVTLAGHARTADAVIHAGMLTGSAATLVDEAATRAMVGALAGSDRPFVYTSGVWVLGPAGPQPATEDSPLNPIALVAWRGPLEQWLVQAAGTGVRTVVLRPGVVRGHGLGIPGKTARGELPLVGDGRQRWATVHVDDLAALYVAAAERAHAGAILHGVAGVLPAAELVRAESGEAPRWATLEEARATLGAFADALALDQDVSADQTRSALGWTPRAIPAASPSPLAGAA
jgi:nucleoside-diphosphate-sugar epimerase